MKVKWLDRDDLDGRDIAGATAIMEACRAIDHPQYPVKTVAELTGLFQHGFDGEPPDLAVVRDERGRVTAVADVWLPRRDNQHIVFATVRVDPELRRRGIGSFLFQEVVEYARRDGRSVIVTDSADRPEYAAFAAAMGQERVYDEVVRRQDLLSLDWSRLEREYRDAQAHAGDYELIRIAGSTPSELLESIATLTAAINDAPHTSEINMEDEVFTPERIREFEAAQEARQVRIYRVAARHKTSGELAGHTVVAIDADQPWYASQYDTSVLVSHRGHRLGLLLKIDMLHWLADEEPQLRELNTANAGSNEHMIGVNETLGYQVIDHSIAWQRTLSE